MYANIEVTLDNDLINFIKLQCEESEISFDHFVSDACWKIFLELYEDRFGKLEVILKDSMENQE